jgi:hypothetical protein
MFRIKINDQKLLFLFAFKGQTLNEIKLLVSLGIYEYLYSSTNTFNMCMNVFYLVSYGLKYSTMLFVKSSLSTVSTPEFWHQLEHLNATDEISQIDVYQVLYWLNSGRRSFIFFPLNS